MREVAARGGDASESTDEARGDEGRGSARRGVPGPAAIPAVVVLSVAAAVFDLRVNHTLGVPFEVAFVLVSVLAVLVVRPGGIVVAMFAPPLVLILAAATGVLVEQGIHGIQGGSSALLLAIATAVLPQFPVMAGTTAATLVFGTIRLLRHRGRSGKVT
ncbi:MAG TPA: DUF6542 domain-containing protein [Amycolatopsis sp.]|nr:DUF6542 domain-containing protein [Amycolatopsis sp.]